MKKTLIFLGLSLSMLTVGAVSVAVSNANPIVAYAFEEETYTYEGVTIVLKSETECEITLDGETKTVPYTREGNKVILDGQVAILLKDDGTFEEWHAPAYISVEKIEHGSVEASILEGEVGEIVTLDVSHEILYKIVSVSVNGVVLIEDENIARRYSFALVEGENVVSVKIEVDKELLGDLSTIYGEIKNKDWTNLFTVDNVIVLVKWVLDCGILLAIIRYYVKDKRLEKKVEKKVEETISKIIPDTTKEVVVANIEKVIAPMFTQMKADNVELMRAMGVFAQCMALAQEDTPESRTAIIELLSGLNISDEKTLAQVKAYIEKLIADNFASYKEVLDSINEINESNQKILEENDKPVEEEVKVEENKNEDDGTEI